jgi:hypothetical protein
VAFTDQLSSSGYRLSSFADRLSSSGDQATASVHEVFASEEPARRRLMGVAGAAELVGNREEAVVGSTDDLPEVRARDTGDSDAGSSATAWTPASASHPHCGALGPGKLIGPVRAARGPAARRNQGDGLPW